jgi:hypothetical protein
MLRAAFPVFLSLCLMDIPIRPQAPKPSSQIWRGSSASTPNDDPKLHAQLPRLDSRQSDFLKWVLGPEGQAIIRSCGTVNLADGIKLVRRFDHYGDPNLIPNLPQLQTQAAEFERELKRRAAEELAAVRPQE